MRKRTIAALAGVAAGAAAGLVVFGTRRTWLGRILRLRPAEYSVETTRRVPVKMRDGVVLNLDHYAPIGSDNIQLPTILVRTPYDRRLGFFSAQRMAERGYNVLLQDVRGRFSSEGEFEPFVHEQQDGLDTLAWLEQQPWFDGKLGMWGSSYLGYVQWAVAVRKPAALKAIVPVMTTSRGVKSAAPQGVFPFELLMRWVMLLEGTDSRGSVPAWRLLPIMRERTIQPLLDHLPMEEAGAKLLGSERSALRQTLTVPQPESLLRTDIGAEVSAVQAPTCFIGGWYDIFLQDLLADYEALRSAGRQPYLTIGPWEHTAGQTQRESLRQGLDWFDRYLKDKPDRLREKPVRIYLIGAEEWREMPYWPPPAEERRYFLQPNAGLATNKPKSDVAPNHYHYSPAQPTPSLGGPLFMNTAGPVNNSPLEARPDVLIYTTPRLERALTVIGPVRAELFVRSSLEHTDFFARMCDVHPDGRSINLCDGIIRLEPGLGDRQPDGSLRIEINMWATANRFKPGHAIRLQISSGAHPRFDRNLGTGELPGKGKDMRIADQTVFLDAEHTSALLLPIVAG